MASVITEADGIVVASDATVDMQRFAGKSIYMASTKGILHNGRAVIEKTLEQPAVIMLGLWRKSTLRSTAAVVRQLSADLHPLSKDYL
jgi:fructose-specific phosphotransferase system component IIB